MLWYIAEKNQPKEMPEEVLIYKIQNGEINPYTLVVNERIREWTPLHEMAIWENNCRQDAGFGFTGMNKCGIKTNTQKAFCQGNDATIKSSENQNKTVSISNKTQKDYSFLIAVVMIFIIILAIFALLISNGALDDNKGYAPDPNRTEEECSYYGTAKVYPSGYHDCIADGDGYYNPAMGHHHHK